MKYYNLISAIIITLAVGIAAWAFAGWMYESPGIATDRRVPGLDGYDPKLTASARQVSIGEHFKRIPYPEVPDTGLPGQWACFRGADRTNVVTDSPALADSWPEAGPPVLWEVSLGSGYAAPSVYGGCVYVLDYLEDSGSDGLRCFSLTNGEEIWRRWYEVKVKNNHGMSRTIPAVTDKYIVTIGPNCHVMCVDRLTGDYRWGIDLVREYGTKIPGWYAGQCPLIENDVAIIAPMGTEALAIGVDCETGNVLWKTPNPHNWEMTHASVMPMTHNGKKMYVVAALGGTAGVSAEKGEEGTVLWETTAFNILVIAPSPLVLPGGKVLLTAGYDAGSALIQVDNDFSVKLLQRFKPRDGLSCEQQTPILYKGLVFGVQPKGAGKTREQFVCCRADNFMVQEVKSKDSVTGSEKTTVISPFIWTSGKKNRFGLGPWIIADDKIFILDDRCTLTMAAFSDREFRILGQHQFWKGHESWGPIAMAGTRMLFRDLTKMVCIELGKK